MSQSMMEESTIMIITYGGSARGYALQAINSAREGDFEEAGKLMKQANVSLKQANAYQEKSVIKELNAPTSTEINHPNLLMVHAQDHFMNALTVVDLAEKFIDLYKELETRPK